MYKAIVFAGTTEGYEISRFLSENKVSVLACVATEYGSRSLEENEFLSIRAERLDKEQMQEAFCSRKTGTGFGCNTSICGRSDSKYP